MLNKSEFLNFLNLLIDYLGKEEKEKIFEQVNEKSDGSVSYPEFKKSFPNLVQMIRIRNVMKDISKLFD